MKEIVATKNAPQAIGPYSQAVKIGASELLFCSGQIPLDPAVRNMPELQRRVNQWDFTEPHPSCLCAFLIFL